MGHIQATGFYMIHQWYAVQNLVATAISDVAIDLSWDILKVGMTGIVIEWTTDGVNYTELDFVGGTETTYNVTGLTANTHYWFRLRGVKASTYSEYSNVADDWTSVTLTVSARGDGSGVAALVIKVSSALELRLSGSARFYTDAAGTLGESTTTTVAATGDLVIKYIKCSSGTCNLQFMDANYLIGFGHAISLGAVNQVWGRAVGGSYDANTPGLNASNWHFPYCIDIGIAYSPIVTFITDLSELSSALERISLATAISITGELSDIGSSCVLFTINGSNTITGNINTLTASMELFDLSGSNTISGDIANLPSGMIQFILYGNNILSGDIADLPQEGLLTRFIVSGLNTISGAVADLDYSGSVLSAVTIFGYNTVSGDPADISSSITDFRIAGNNTFSGDIAGFPATLDYLSIGGTSASLTGDIADLPEGLLQITFTCPNDITGDVANFPSTLTYIFIQGSNTISGNVSGIPAGVTTIMIHGSNVISGNVSGIPAAVSNFYIYGSNTISGSVAGFPSTIRYIYIEGSNTLSGTVADIPDTIIQFSIKGVNTISGDLADISNAITYFVIEGSNTISVYTSGKTWSNSFIYSFHSKPVSGGLDATEVDNLFIDLDTSWTTTRSQTIDMRGTNAAPTATSAAARTSLIAKGRTIYVNN